MDLIENEDFYPCYHLPRIALCHRLEVEMGDSVENKIVENGEGKSSKKLNQEPTEGKEPDSPSQKTKSKIGNSDPDEVVENDTEEGGYKSDRSASDDGSTDAVVDRRRNKGSSGYEESGEEDGVSEISEGIRTRGEQEEDEYDEEATADASSGDDISENVNEEDQEGYEEDTEEEDEVSEDEEVDVTNPSFVPKRTGFWDHDDRYENIKVEESRNPRRGKYRQLWDKTAGRWEHDLYKEEEQGPKQPWEIEQTLEDFEKSKSRGRGRREFGDFVGGRGRSRGRPSRPSMDRTEGERNRPPRERGRGRGRGRVSRGRPRGRGGFREERITEREESRQWDGDARDDVEYAWQAGLDDDSNKETNRNEASTAQREKPVPKKASKKEPREPKESGKRASHATSTSSKKSPVAEFNEEKVKKTEQVKDRFEDSAVNDETAGGDHGVKKVQSTNKPKRYSSQRQKANTGDDQQQQQQQLQNQANESATIHENQIYETFPQQGAVDLVQYQMQQLQFQMQALQAQEYENAMTALQQQQLLQQSPESQAQQQPQQQVQVQPGQVPQIITPAMHQYMQHQLLLQYQALQRSQIQQQQQTRPQLLSKENGQQQVASEEGVVLQGNTFAGMQPGIRPYDVSSQPPTGIYPQSGSPYEVPYEQIMAQRPGLFIPPMQYLQQQQQMQMIDAQRKARSAAIPIKPPPDQQEYNQG